MIPVSPISPVINLFGFTFHMYGLIVGVGIISALSIIEKKAKNQSLSVDVFWKMVWFVLIIALVGARLWHVFTDFHLYRDNLQDILYIANGGLSIVGGLLGGALAVLVGLKSFDKEKSYTWKSSLDLVAFGLPLGQAIGRLGNYVNQELYGFPTDVPWKLFISKEYRLLGFENYEYYHPLFLYEMIPMLVLFFFLSYLHTRNHWKIGSGMFAALYVAYYSLLRIVLDFFRIDSAVLFYSLIGINQIIFFIAAVIAVVILYIHERKKSFAKSTIR